MRLEGTLTASDFVSARYLLIRPSPVFSVAGVVLLILFALATVVDPSFVLVGFWFFFSAFFFIYFPWHARREFRQSETLSEPFSIEVRDEGLFTKKSYGEGLVPWNHIRRSLHGRKVLLLFTGPKIIHIIPRHVLENAGAYAEFVKLVTQRHRAAVQATKVPAGSA